VVTRSATYFIGRMGDGLAALRTIERLPLR